MRRYISILVICATLLGSSALTAFAASLNLINTTTKGQDLLVDVSIKDGDLVQALTTLFNQTGYQVRIGPGVTGTIADLQFTQQPFEEALKQMLASVNPNIKFEKQDQNFYRIDSDEETSKVSAAPITVKTVNTERVKELKIISVQLPPLNSRTTTTTTDNQDGAPASEEAFVSLVTINYLDLESLCYELGDSATYIAPLIGVDGFGYGGGGGYSNNRNNRNINNRYNTVNNNRNNNNNNGYYNNNNNGYYNNNNYVNPNGTNQNIRPNNVINNNR